MDMVYNKIMSRIRACIKCNQISIIHGHDLCAKCYYKECNQRPETKERKRIFQKKYYQKNKERIVSKNRAYQKTGKGKKVKQKYDKKHRDDLRFDGNRETIFQRDSYQCQECGETKRLAIHHIDGKSTRNNSAAVNNELNNLITLCHSCHMKKHSGQRNPAKKFWDFVSKAARMSIPELEELANKMKNDRSY